MRILIVDDAVDAADTLATLLVLNGHEVAVAYDGAQALSSTAAYRPDAVVLDLGLPDMHGFEVAVQVRALCGESVLLIAYTGYVEQDVRPRALAAGIDKFLTKPVALDVLERALIR